MFKHCPVKFIYLKRPCIVKKMKEIIAFYNRSSHNGIYP